MSQDVSPVKCNISRLISCLLLSGLMQIHIEYPKQKKGNKKKTPAHGEPYDFMPNYRSSSRKDLYFYRHTIDINCQKQKGAI